MRTTNINKRLLAVNRCIPNAFVKVICAVIRNHFKYKIKTQFQFQEYYAEIETFYIVFENKRLEIKVTHY